MPDHHGTLKKGGRGRRSAVSQSLTHSLNQLKVNPARDEEESEVDIKCKARAAIYRNALHYVLGRAIKKCQRLLVKLWIVFAYAVSFCLLP